LSAVSVGFAMAYAPKSLIPQPCFLPCAGNWLQKELVLLSSTKHQKNDGRASAYVCENFTCRMPVNTRKKLAAQLDGKFTE